MSDIKNIFIDRPPIYLSDNITVELDEHHKRLEADKALVSGDSVLIDIDNITELPDGRIRFEIGTARFECFFHRGTQKRLYILLGGARTLNGGKMRSIPQFSRWSWYTYTDCSWLCIEDPMYFENENLNLGWFYGNKTINYRSYVAFIAGKIVEHLKIKKRDVVFYGSSGGGTAAIHAAALFGSGVAVSINGQINFEYEHYNSKIKQFIDETKIDIRKEDRHKRNKLCDIVQKAKDVRFILIENCRSPWDLNDHLKYLAGKMNIQPTYGISQFSNMIIWIYDAKSGRTNSPHSAFENKNLFYAIDFLAKLVSEHKDIERYKPLFLLFNEIWYDFYDEKNNEERKITISPNEMLTEKQIVQKLIWNRRKVHELSRELDEIKSIK